MPTVPGLDAAGALATTDLLWLTQGTGDDRDRKATLDELRTFTLAPLSWESVDLTTTITTSAIYTGLATETLVVAAPNSSIKLGTIGGMALLDGTVIWELHSANPLNAFQAGFTLPLEYDGVPSANFRKLIPCAIRKQTSGYVHVSTTPCFASMEESKIMFYKDDGTELLWSDVFSGASVQYATIHMSAVFLGAVVG